MPLGRLHVVQADYVWMLQSLQNGDLRLQILLKLLVETRTDDGLDGYSAFTHAILPAVHHGERSLA